MGSKHFFAVVSGLVAITLFAADASAYYHPTVGRFVQRDPGAGGGMRVGAAAAQYADGMNLYQYVRGNPVRHVDPTGLWNEDVHRGLTRDMMKVLCPNIAEAVAGADQGMDENGHGAPEIVIVGWLTLGLNSLRPEVQEDYNYHFPGAGAPFPGQKPVEQGFNNSTVTGLLQDIIGNEASPRFCSPSEFGKFLHMLQDSWSHGGAAPDSFGHPNGVEMTDINGKTKKSKGWTKTNVDDPIKNYGAYTKMKEDVISAMLAFFRSCPCACAGGKGDHAHPGGGAGGIGGDTAGRMREMDVPSVSKELGAKGGP